MKLSQILEARYYNQEPIHLWSIGNVVYTGHEPHVEAYYRSNGGEYEPQWDEETNTIVYDMHISDESDFREDRGRQLAGEDEQWDGEEHLSFEIYGTQSQIDAFLKLYHPKKARGGIDIYKNEEIIEPSEFWDMVENE